MNSPLRALIVEDSEDDALLTTRELQRGGYAVTFTQVETAEAMTSELERQAWDVIISDYSMPRFSGTDALLLLRRSGLDIPFILLSGAVGEDVAVEAMKSGAHDYILKGNMRRLVPAVKRALAEIEVRKERRRAEKALADKMEELARSNAELEHFAYVASHDLQEPLRMVACYTQMLAKKYEGRLDADADECIHFAVEGASRMQQLLIDLLRHSQVGAKGRNFALTNCENALQAALDLLRGQITENDASITHDPLPTVMADRLQIEQLFQNLIGNSIKFRGEEPPCVHVSAEKEDSAWVFAVRDNGIGIDPKYADRIFIVFKRLHTRDEYPGTGIGLAICKRIVEHHGGRIWVESTPNEGATFFFTLPFTPRAETEGRV